jgi:transposase-like protein
VESRLAGKVRAAVEDVLNDIEEWRIAPFEGGHPYVYLDGIWLKRAWGGEVRNVSLLVAVGVNRDGFRNAFVHSPL